MHEEQGRTGCVDITIGPVMRARSWFAGIGWDSDVPNVMLVQAARDVLLLPVSSLASSRRPSRPRLVLAAILIFGSDCSPPAGTSEWVEQARP